MGGLAPFPFWRAMFTRHRAVLSGSLGNSDSPRTVSRHWRRSWRFSGPSSSHTLDSEVRRLRLDLASSVLAPFEQWVSRSPDAL